MIHIYGIKNCNSVKKSLDWMNENSVEYVFHDFKKEGVSEEQLKSWASSVNWENLINKKGTTWRKIPLELQNSMNTLEKSIPVLIENTSLIKRPVVVTEKGVVLGYDPDTYRNILK